MLKLAPNVDDRQGDPQVAFPLGLLVDSDPYTLNRDKKLGSSHLLPSTPSKAPWEARTDQDL